MKMVILVLTIALSQILLINSVLIETGKRSTYCFHKEFHSGDSMHVSYVVSGENEEKVSAILMDPNGAKLFEKHESDGADNKYEIQQSGNYKLCFYPQGTASYYISFEFFSVFEKGHTLDMAKDSNIGAMKKDVNDITLMFEEMEKNIKFIMDRRNKHTMVMNDIGSSIKHISYFKIIIVVLVSALQVFLISRFLGGSKKSSAGYSTNGLFEMSGSSL
jgi:hypothetical protein